jgi:hypothetical protein
MNRFYRASQRNASRFITARFDGTCAETGQAVPKGADCLYSGGKVYHESSKAYADFKSAEFDREALGHEY